jgi:quinoprotein glucose dehydrogenase
MRRYEALIAALGIVCALAGCSRVADQPALHAARDIAASEADATGWPSYGGQPSGTKYAALDQINLNTVAHLAQAWVWHSGEVSTGTAAIDATVSEMTPIYADNRLYTCTPFSRVVALDPASGRSLWSFDPHKPRTGNMYHENYCRGVAYWQAAEVAQRAQPCGKRVLFATQTGVLVALDADSGRSCGDFGAGGSVNLARLDYHGDGLLAETSPPAIVGDVVVVGAAVQDNAAFNALDGIVRGFDVRTGRELWSWNPIPPDLSAVTGAANAWAPISVDVRRGWVFVPTGSASWDPYGVNRLDRTRGVDRIPDANAVVALDARTGRKIWSFQTVHHDLWDYDVPAMPTLATIAHNGRPTEAVIQPTKTGNVFVLDRATGRPLFPVVERPVPASDVPGERAAPTQPMPVLPRPVASQSITTEQAWGVLGFDTARCRARLGGLRNDGMFTPPGLRGSVLRPSFLGGTDWGGLAYDPGSGLAVVNSSNVVSAITLVPRTRFDPAKVRPGVAVYQMTGSPYVFEREVLLSPLGAPCSPPPWGQLTAIDMATGRTRWQIPFGRVPLWGGLPSPAAWGAPNQGGPIVTRGGLIFIGASLDSRLRAYDIQTGREVWSAAVPAPATATPMTFRHSDGRQYVVVAAGGHGGFGTRLGDAIVAFALPRDN